MDSRMENVDIAIPSNNKGKESIALLYWMLAREVLYLRGTISRSTGWEVMVDSFFWRDPEELERQEEAEQGFQQPAWNAAGNAGDDWGAQGAAGESWADAGAGDASWDAPAAGAGND